MTASEGSAVDLDLRGIVGLRIVGATASEVQVVARQLGLAPSRLSREPDITIRFVSSLALASPIRTLGRDEAGFTDDGLFLVRARGGRRRALIALDRVGAGVEILCERGIRQIPHLVALVNLTALARRFVPVHAAAFRYAGSGVLVIGWAKGGKSETLLAFMAKGAEYVGDEWIYLSPSTGQMAGLPEPMRVWQWQLASMPRYREAVAAADRLRLGAGAILTAATAGAAGRTPSSTPGLERTLRKLQHLLERQLSVRIDPERLFKGRIHGGMTSIDHVLLVTSRESDSWSLERVDTQDVARRAVFSLEYERLDLRALYLMFRFAFPDRPNPVLEQAESLQREFLLAALAGKTAWQVEHPYPLHIPELFDRIAPVLSAGADAFPPTAVDPSRETVSWSPSH